MQQIGGSAACTIVSNNCTSAGGYGRYNETYSYDPLGNLDVKAGVNLDYNTSRPHAVTHYNNTQRYWYDANGNMETRLDGSATWNYDWTIDNKLREADNGTTTVTFTYDADGNMVLRDDNGTSTVCLGKLYQHKLSPSTETRHYAFNGQLVAWRQNTTVRFLLSDHLGGTNTTLTSIGQLLANARYDPWGKERYSNGTMPAEYRYTGQRADTTLGIYDYQARYYDPAIGRFLSADSIVPNPATPQSLNRYAYTLNNPLRYTDPTGHCPDGCVVEIIILVAFFALVVEVATPNSSYIADAAEGLSYVAIDIVDGVSSFAEQFPLAAPPGILDTGSRIPAPKIPNVLADPTPDPNLTLAESFPLEAPQIPHILTNGATPGGRNFTNHGARQQAARMGPSRVDEIIDNPTRTYTQADGATVYISGKGDNYDFVIVGEEGIVTVLSNQNKQQLRNFANNHGWEGFEFWLGKIKKT